MGRGSGGGGRSASPGGGDTSANKAREAADAKAKAEAKQKAEEKAAKAQKATKQSPFKGARERSQTQAGFNSVVKEALEKKGGTVSLASLRKLTGLPRDKFDKFIRGATDAGIGYRQGGEGVNVQRLAMKTPANRRSQVVAAAKRKNQRLFEAAVDGDRQFNFTQN